MLNLNLSLKEDKQALERVRKANEKKQQASYQPTWEEVWYTGYVTHTGKRKKGIFQSKLTDSDRQKLLEVKQAIENGELGVGVDDMKKFTKAHALRLYKELVELQRERMIQKLVKEKPDNYITVDDVEKLEKLIKDLDHEHEIAIDTETTGLDYFVDEIVGISMTLPKADYHVYIPVAHKEGKQLDRDFVFEKLRPHLESDRLKKIYFNAKFDIHMFLRHGIKMGGFGADTLIIMKLLNENEPNYALKALATKYGHLFGFDDKSATFEELFGKTNFKDVPIEVGTVYACKDTHLTYEFYKWQLTHLDRLPKIKKLYFEIENPITEVCIAMEQAGFLIDMEFAREYEKELSEQLAEIESELEQYFGKVNLNSPTQLQKLFYDDLGLPDISGKRSTDKKVLKVLAKQHEGIALLLQYRDLKKLLSTYVKALPNKVKRDGRLHGQFNQADTATGRFASRDPNLQNLPPRARHLVIAPNDSIIVGIDYSQIEPRVLAHLSGDEELQRAYKEGKDLYTLMASRVFNLPIEYCVDKAKDPTGTFEPRKRIKSVFLGIMYGMGSKTLAESINSTEEEAEQIIQDFFKAYPKVKEFVEKSHRFAEENEYVETMFGRKRRFPKHKRTAKAFKIIERRIETILGRKPKFIWDEDLPYDLKKQYWELSKPYFEVCRQSVNTQIQGSAADILKLAMIEVHKWCVEKTRKTGKTYRVIATVHDELLFELPRDATREEIEELENIMKTVVKLDVPLKVDTEIMLRWGEGMSKDEWFSNKEVA
jgi:DNA polymerase I